MTTHFMNANSTIVCKPAGLIAVEKCSRNKIYRSLFFPCIQCRSINCENHAAGTNECTGPNQISTGQRKISLEGNASGPADRRRYPHTLVAKGSKVSEALTSSEEAPKAADAKLVQKRNHLRFHAEGGLQVLASTARATSSTFIVEIQIDSPIASGLFHLHWGLFRSDSTGWVLLDPDAAPPETKYILGNVEAMRTPFKVERSGLQTLSLDFNSEQAPFYVSFVLFKPGVSNEREMWTRSSTGENFCIPVGIRRGSPDPLGITWGRDGAVNFALYSKNAEHVILCLYEDNATEPSLEIDLERSVHRTGDVWHAQLESLDKFTRYGYRCKGEASWENGNRFHSRYVLLDPYAKLVAPFVAGQEKLPSPAPILGWLKKEIIPFDWEDDSQLRIPVENLVGYRLNVASFTADLSSGLEEGVRGTFLGITQKLQHLLSLGINAVILQPIFAHNDNRYNPVSFFAPMPCYGPGDSLEASIALKEMVKQLHKNGIEVILDVVYSHTGEGGDESPKLMSFRGIDNATFYILNKTGKVVKSEFGTDNSFSCNHPVVHRMILDSLRYWVDEFHVDGFCFVNAAALVTGPHGQELSRPLLIEAISFDPVLASTKLIADSYSPFTQVCKPLSFPHWRRWSEWNNYFPDDTRRFIRGDAGQLSKFATRLCGSGGIFSNGLGPTISVNSVTNPYGFTLADLVSFSETKGALGELSWNCGAEGPTDDLVVLEARVKQVRNFLTVLFLSEGVPILNMGDEYGHSKGGEVDLEERSSLFQWSFLESDFGQQTMHLIFCLKTFRLRCKDFLQQCEFQNAVEITWHGTKGDQPLWDDEGSFFLAVQFHAKIQKNSGTELPGNVYLAFNPQQHAVVAALPKIPSSMVWHKIADTSAPYPHNFPEKSLPILPSKTGRSTTEVQSHSSVLLEARPAAAAQGKTMFKTF